MLLRPLCWMTGHDWRTIKKDNTIWVRECKFCGKVEKIILIAGCIWYKRDRWAKTSMACRL